MRALTFDGKNVRLVTNHPTPIANADESVIRLVKAAIGRTEVEVAKGLFNFCGVLGQQFVGVVESVNGPLSNLVGKRVVGSPATYCGKCELCVAGLSRHCRNRTIIGMIGRDGCLADRFTLPTANLATVPDSVDSDHAVFALDVAAAVQAAGQLTIIGKPYITVLGDGPLGLVTAQVMAKLNASVRLIGKHSEKLAICEKWGIKHRHVNDIGRRADQDVVVDCTGSPAGLELAMQLVRPRGKVLLKSMYAGTGARQHRNEPDLTPVVSNEVEVIGSFLGSVTEGLSLLTSQEVDVISLISRRSGLNDGLGVLKIAAQPAILKVIVDV